MKYILIFFISFSLNSFAQIERTIFLQTNPEDQYVISYTSGEYTFLFSYNDFMDLMPIDESEVKPLSELIDSKIKSQGFVDLSADGQEYIADGEVYELNELSDKHFIRRLISSGNFILLDSSGKMKLSNLKFKSETTLDGEHSNVLSCVETGDIVFEYKRRFGLIGTGCPSF